MDSRYKDRGYSAEFMENDYGAFITLRRNGKIIGEVGIGLFSGGDDEVIATSAPHLKNEVRRVYR